jgi:hypothetical protein
MPSLAILQVLQAERSLPQAMHELNSEIAGLAGELNTIV